MDPSISKRPDPIEEDGQDATDPVEAGIPLPAYQCHKIVRAAQIKSIDVFTDYALLHTLVGSDPITVTLAWHNRHKPKAADYYVQYADGYESVSPPEAFEAGYRPLNHAAGSSFADVLEALPGGARACRVGWNGAGMFIFLVPGSTFEVNRKPLLGIYPEGTVIDYQPHIDMRTANGTIVPWLASQSDLLTDDWIILPPTWLDPR